jgi:hypothetical protein
LVIFLNDFRPEQFVSFESQDTELDNLELPSLPNATPKANGAKAAPKNGQAGPASTKVPTVKWGDPKVQSGDGLPRIKATTERQLRFALIPDVDPAGHKEGTHFIKTPSRSGYFACPGTGCPLCAKEDARWLGAALAVHYTNADENGKIPPDVKPTYAIGYISLSVAHFKTLSEASEGVTPFDIDWVQSFDGKRYALRPVTLVPRYRKAGDEEAIVKLAKPLIPKLGNKIGKKISALEMKQMLANAPTLESGIEDMESE